MPSPFPGMDPYIEKPAIWPDFHDALVSAIRGLLQPQLRPKYVALMQERWFVVDRTARSGPMLRSSRPTFRKHDGLQAQQRLPSLTLPTSDRPGSRLCAAPGRAPLTEHSSGAD